MRQSNYRAITGGYRGTGEFRRLAEKYETELIFDVSKELQFTRDEAITKYQLANFKAIKNLEIQLKALNVKTVRRLFELDPASLLRTDGIGTVTLWVAMCILDKHGYNVAEWWGWLKGDKVREAKRHAHPAVTEPAPVHA